MRSPRLCVVGPGVRVVAAAVISLSISALLSCVAALSQEPAPQPPAVQSKSSESQSTGTRPSGTATNKNSAAESSSKGKKSTHAHDFLIHGTVFQPSGMAFPAVKLRVRRESEKKFRWQTVTNSRGEFSVRVPQGLQYEVAVAAKGFAEQSRQIDARSGVSEENVAFRLEAVTGGKKK
jgi:hypothetical protein